VYVKDTAIIFGGIAALVFVLEFTFPIHFRPWLLRQVRVFLVFIRRIKKMAWISHVVTPTTVAAAAIPALLLGAGYWCLGLGNLFLISMVHIDTDPDLFRFACASMIVSIPMMFYGINIGVRPMGMRHMIDLPSLARRVGRPRGTVSFLWSHSLFLIYTLAVGALNFLLIGSMIFVFDDAVMLQIGLMTASSATQPLFVLLLWFAILSSPIYACAWVILFLEYVAIAAKAILVRVLKYPSGPTRAVAGLAGLFAWLTYLIARIWF